MHKILRKIFLVVRYFRHANVEFANTDGKIILFLTKIGKIKLSKSTWIEFFGGMLTLSLLFLSCAAARTKNYSGAELEGVVKSAVSYALNRQLSLEDLTKQVEEENIKVTMEDFLNALQEVIPAFGASTDDLERCRYYFYSRG